MGDEMTAAIATQILTSRPSLHDIALILEAVERACEAHGKDGADIAWYIGHALDEARHSIQLEEAGERDSMWPARRAA
jgi:hypothetical protein